MRRITTGIVLLGSLIALTTGGCAVTDPVRAPFPGNVDQIPQGQHPTISVEDPALAHWLVFGSVRVDPPQPEPGRALTVVQPVRNTADYPINIQYRYEFIDEKGFPLRSQPGFRLLRLPSRTEMFMEATASEASAQEWRIIVRPAR